MIKSNNFSLIELLSVMAFFAILLSLLMASLNTISRRSESLECSFRLKSVFLLVHQQSEDRNNLVNLNGSRGRWWAGRLYNEGYLEDHEANLISCPSVDNKKSFSTRYFDWATFGMRHRFEVDQSFKIPESNASHWYWQEFNTSLVPNPNSFHFLGDSIFSTKNSSWSQANSYRTRGNATWVGLHARHSARCNMFYLDGSLQSIDEYDLITSIGTRHYYIGEDPTKIIQE